MVLLDEHQDEALVVREGGIVGHVGCVVLRDGWAKVRKSQSARYCREFGPGRSKA